MTPELVVQLARRSFEATLLLSAPLLIFSLVVGLLISIFQAVTSINEATLAFAPKIAAVMVAMVIFFPWMMMLPPVMISLPFKILLFVLVDGWGLIIGSLVKSFG